MLKPAAATAQTELEMVTLDQPVPRDHLLRLIGKRRPCPVLIPFL